ncbi:hypothetical protein [Rhizobium leguminosarum]|uniref:hypothetical protein n=1 Tax=Rhizobium leguminosarum TaxID=384 RepID=UPI003F9E500E
MSSLLCNFLKPVQQQHPIQNPRRIESCSRINANISSSFVGNIRCRRPQETRSPAEFLKNPMTRKEQSTWIMRKAWQLAKAGADRFGGKAREYLGEAIRQAWAPYRETVAASRPAFMAFKDAVVESIIVPVAEKLAEIAIAVVEFITPMVVLRARRFVRWAMSLFTLPAPVALAVVTVTSHGRVH